MKGLGEGRSRRKERRKWALLPPTQPTSPPPEGPRTAEIWGLKWRLWKPERWSEEGERPGLISPRLSLLPHPLWCCSLKIFPVSQSLVGVPGLLSLSGFSHPLYPLPGSGVRVEGGQGGGNLFCYIGTGLGTPGALTLQLREDSSKRLHELCQSHQNSWFVAPWGGGAGACRMEAVTRSMVMVVVLAAAADV